MMDSTTKKMISRLMEETSTGRLKWTISDAPSFVTRGSENVVPLYFVSSFRGKNICIYELRSKQFVEDQQYWSDCLVLGIVDHEGRVVWDYSGNDSMLHELFNDVRKSSADVEDFLGYFR